MAVNPMQRRVRNSFLLGLIIAFLIMGLFAALLIYKINGLKTEIDTQKKRISKVLVAKEPLESGQEVTMDLFTSKETITDMNKAEIISADDFEFYDNQGNIVEKFTEDGTPLKKTLVMKVGVPKGCTVTKDMVVEMNDQTQNDQRIQEYNMIILPSELKNGSYVDIRLRFPTGEDYIVISKKKVLQCTADTIWMKLSEDEILTLGNAIVEAYVAEGTKLYATMYAEPGVQNAAIPTYPVSQAVLKLINSDPNIRVEAKNGLWQRYNEQNQNEQRVQTIDATVSRYNEDRASNVESGLQEEINSLKEAREEFVTELEGTGAVGRE